MNSIRERIKKFTDLFGVEIPILNAPMSGVVTTEMVAAVSEAGGLGVLPLDFLEADEITKAIKELRALTKKPFAVNLRIPVKRNEAGSEALLEALSLLREENHLERRKNLPHFDAQFDAVLKSDVPAIQVSFGGLREIYVEKLESRAKETGKKPLLIGAATTLREAKVQRAAGVDAVLVQGAEAGGPRLSFEDTDKALISLMSLVGPAARSTALPVIASGGIASGAQGAAALLLGASALEVGTYLLRTKECAMHEMYEEALEFASDTTTRFTRLISGRLTRAIPTELIRALDEAHVKAIEYPAHLECMRPIFELAKETRTIEYADLSCGTSVPGLVPKSTKEAISQLWKGTQEELNKGAL